MKKLRKSVSLMVAAAILTTTGLTACQSDSGKEVKSDVNVTLRPGEASVFHDTNGDGLGEFEGWGTSLCWWANRVGYDETLTEKAAEVFFGDSGLDMNIGRYNVGGGDLVTGKYSDEESAALAAEETWNTFGHANHIKRSDSAVPGYACDVTPVVITDETPLNWYQENFARVDEECGYAWNYNWEADANQMAVLKAAAKASGEDFTAEAFSNSPPYFMTESGCSSGGEIPNTDNLRADSYQAFASYMADVIEHWNQEGIISFQSVSPMNEPYTDYWSAGSNKQEGCHVEQGESQSKILLTLNEELKTKGIDIILSGTDETSIDVAFASYGALSDEAKAAISRIDTHTYGGSMREQLKNLAISEEKNLWMSEVDGSFVAGKKAGEMSAALGFAKRIMKDINELQASAWILWNAIDMHVDTRIGYTSDADYTSWDNFKDRVNFQKGYWGIAVADHDAKDIMLTRKYYAYGQFSRYIRPGYTIIGSDNENVLAAYDPQSKQVVIVVVNESDKKQTWEFDLSAFDSFGTEVEAIRTSGDSSDGENWMEVTEVSEIKADTEDESIQVLLKENSITTFIVKDVEYDLAAHMDTIASVEDVNLCLELGDTLVLPETVVARRNNGETVELAVEWKLDDVDQSQEFTTVGTVTGTDLTVELSVMYVPKGLLYFIDCNSKSSPIYAKMAEYVELSNDVADQAYTEGSWGYVDSYGAYNGAVNDLYDCGWWAKSGQTIEYKIPLEAGSYYVDLGFKEWWKDSNRYRYMNVSLTVGEKSTELGVSNTWDGSNWWNQDTYEFKLEEAAEITIGVAKSTSSDPVLSFIQIRSAEE